MSGPRYAVRVTQGRDEDALSWDGDDDPTLDSGAPASDQAHQTDEAPDEADDVESGDVPAAEPTQSAAEKTPAVAEPANAPAAAEQVEHAHMSNAALVTIGILGGFYLLFTAGWLVGGFRMQGRAQYLVADVMFQGSFWLAVLAPALWFGTVFLLTRHSRPWLRIVWLVAGAILLVPWPFIMVGTVGR